MNWQQQAEENKKRQEMILQKKRQLLLDTKGEDSDEYWNRYNWRMSRMKLEQMGEDPERVIRLAHEKTCRYCHYYRGGIGLDAFTSYSCGSCGKTSHHENSNVPLLCKKCAEENHVCVRCGNAL